MTATAVLDRFETLLAEEREAIRRIDADGIVRLADEKESLMRTLVGRGVGKAEGARFRAIVDDLRHNSVLLVHARNCVRDVIQAAVPPSGAYGVGGSTHGPPQGGRLSVTG